MPVTVARMSVLRTFLNIVSFRGARAPKQAHGCGLKGVGSSRMGALERAVWFGHDSGGPDLPGGLLPTGCGLASALRSPAHTRVRGFNFRYSFVTRLRANRDRTRPEAIRHVRKMAISFR